MAEPQQIIFSNDIAGSLARIAGEMRPTSVVVVTDDEVKSLVLPRLGLPADWTVCSFAPGDVNKNLESLAAVWGQMEEAGATRHSTVVNIGGGVVTDLGGFAAATFKRGVRFVNVPTTLLAAVDAAVGGKTGVNFNEYKNEIGAFAPADAVVISSATFDTLPAREILSGYAEMVKHGLLDSAEAYRALIAEDPLKLSDERMLELLEYNVGVKERVVTADPFERGIRRALNLGHTPGHAFESLALHRGRPVPHGFAVAWGLLVDMILSHMELGFASDYFYPYRDFLRDNGYGTPEITCDDYDTIVDLMRHDKKNASPDAINFTLLRAPGDVCIDCVVTADKIKAALDIFRDLTEA